MKEIYTISSISSLTYFQAHLFPVVNYSDQIQKPNDI